MEILSPDEFFKRVGTPDTWKPLNPEGVEEMRSIDHLIPADAPIRQGEKPKCPRHFYEIDGPCFCEPPPGEETTMEGENEKLEMTPEQKMREEVKARVKGRGGEREIRGVRIYEGQEQALSVAPGTEVLGVGLNGDEIHLYLMQDPTLGETQRLDIAVRYDGDDCKDLHAHQYVGSIPAPATPGEALPENIRQPTIYIFNRSK